MNGDTANGATNRLVTLDNEATPDDDGFTAAAPAASASAIDPDAHFLSSGLKLDIEIFLKENIKNMADKDTIGTNPAPDSPGSDTPDSASQYAGSADSNSPH